MTTEIVDLFREICEMRLASLSPVARIRISRYAIAGSAAVMPLSPERARVYAPLTHEIIIHPDDWDALRRSPQIRPHVVGADQITAFLGLPVVEEP